MLTKKDKADIIKALESVDVKRLEIDHDDTSVVKWFRFGSYTGLHIATEIVRQMPERKPRKKAQEVS